MIYLPHHFGTELKSGSASKGARASENDSEGTVDLNKLTQSEKVICGSGVALLVFSFLPWFGLGGYSNNGWKYFLFGTIPVLLGVIMVAQVYLSRFTATKLPELPISWGQVHLIAGCAAAALILLKLLMGDDAGVAGFSIDLDRKFGIFLSAIAAIGLAAGGFLKSKEPLDTPPL